MKKLLLLIITVIMISMTLNFSASATSPESVGVGSIEYKAEICMSTCGERFEAGSMNALLYKKVKAFFESVAKGSEAEPKLKLEGNDLPSGLSWTSADLGVPLVEGNSVTEAASQKIGEAISSRFDLTKVMLSVMSDCPYEQFWYDKAKGVSFFYSMSGTSEELSISSIEFNFNIIKDYQGSSADKFDKAKILEAKTNVESAKFIVDEYKNHNDYDKLKGYAEKICFHAAYDHDAVDNGSPYGSQWQIINVFDGLTNTNVVCEGYAKAFKYLCDLTDFEGDVECYTVSGTMNGGTGEGAHMWNVVKYNGKNYLVDVTNCDSGTIGNGLKLFMRGVSSTDGGRTYKMTVGKSTITYVYDTNQKDLHQNGYLVLDTKDAGGCDHSQIKTITAQASTCTEKGWKEYKKCEKCSTLFNKNGDLITSIPYIDLEPHKPTEVKDDKYLLSKGNCAKASLYYKSCKTCKQALDETFEGDKTDHDIVEVWFVENGYHFYRCSVCSHKENYGKCSGGTATCTAQAKCDTCKLPYGDFAPHNFGDWKNNSDTHWKECSCSQKTDIASHTDKNTDGKCDTCSYSMPVASEPPKDESKPPVAESKPPVDESKPPVAESKPAVPDESVKNSKDESITPPEASDESISESSNVSLSDESTLENSETESTPTITDESVADESETEISDEECSHLDESMSDSKPDTSYSVENIKSFDTKTIVTIAVSIAAAAAVATLIIIIVKKKK